MQRFAATGADSKTGLHLHHRRGAVLGHCRWGNGVQCLMRRGGLAAWLLVVIRCGLVAARPSLQAFQVGCIHVFRTSSGICPALASRTWRGIGCFLPSRFGNGHDAPAIRTFPSFGPLITSDLQPPATGAIESHIAVFRLSCFRPLRWAATNPDLCPTPGTG